MKFGNGSKRPIRIDELLRDQHRHLQPDDVCYFLREYEIGAGYEGETNSLILNFKKTPNLADRPEWVYKERAIEKLAQEVAACLEAKREYFATVTFVPMPPSRSREDPLYDDRLCRLPHKVGELCSFKLDVKELLQQTRSTLSSSREAVRPSVEELIRIYRVSGEAGRRIVVFDDVLTTGAHFRAASHHLKRSFPGAAIFGFFLARSRRPHPREP